MSKVHKNKFAVLLIAIVLTLVPALSACTCSEPAVKEPAPVEKESSVKEEATEEAAAGLSFEAAQYVNTEYGFSVKYPKDWKEVSGEGWPEAAFYAAAPGQVPILGVGVQDVEDEAATFADVLTALSEAAGESGIEIVSEVKTTLADGTPAAGAVVKWTVQGFPGDTFVLGAIKDNRWVIVTVTTISLLAPYDEALFSEIAHTLQLVLPPRVYSPKAGTIAVEPAHISCSWRDVMDVPITFTGAGWPANELVTIELVIPPGVSAPGLDRAHGEDSVAIASATADGDGNLEVKWPNSQKAIWLLRSRIGFSQVPGWRALSYSRVNPLPGGRYTVRARAEAPAPDTIPTIWDLRPDIVATTTWYLRLR